MDLNMKRTKADDNDQSKAEGRESVRRRIPLKMFGRKFNSKRLLVSSKVWMHTIPTEDCDIVLTLPATTSDATLMWLLARLRSRVPHLSVHFRHHSNSAIYGLYMTASYESLLQGAEELGIPKPLRGEFGGGMKEFVLEDQECFEGVSEERSFLTSQERQSIVQHMLNNLRATEGEELDNVRFLEGQPIVPRLVSKNVVSGVFPMHCQDDLIRLRHAWVLSFTRPQPLDDICRYFGTKIGMYFAYLGHYTMWLVLPAVLGVVLWLVQGLSQWWDDVSWVMFSVFNVFWATLYILSWKRTGALFAYCWGTLDRKDDLLKDSRPLYKGNLQRSPITGHLEPFYPVWKRNLFRYCVSAPVIFLCLCMVFNTMLLIFKLQEWVNVLVAGGDTPGFLRFVPKILMAVAISVLDELYKQVAVWLNNKENHRLEETHETNLVIKLVLFQFVNSYLALFYVAFYMQDMDRLRELLAALLITRQILGNIKEVLLPLLKWKGRLYSVGYKIASEMSSRTLDREVEKVTKAYRRKLCTSTSSATILTSTDTSSTVYDTASSQDLQDYEEEEEEEEEGDVNHSAVDAKRSSRESTSREREGASKAKEVSSEDYSGVLTQAEVESAMAVYDNAFEDYLEMVVQFGYVTLFSSAFPLAALCALLNNLIEIRSDAFKLCYTHQRPFGVRVHGIGIWQDVLQVMVLMAVIVNSALIGMGDLVHRMVPGISDTGTIILIVIVEHVILLVKASLEFAIPDMPLEVATQMAKVEYQRREALKRIETQGGADRSPRTRPPDGPSTSRFVDPPVPAPRRFSPAPSHQSLVGHRPHNYNASNSQDERQRGGNPWGSSGRGSVIPASRSATSPFSSDSPGGSRRQPYSPTDDPFRSPIRPQAQQAEEAQQIYRKSPDSVSAGKFSPGCRGSKVEGGEKSYPRSLCRSSSGSLYSRVKTPEVDAVSYFRSTGLPYASAQKDSVVMSPQREGSSLPRETPSPQRDGVVMSPQREGSSLPRETPSPQRDGASHRGSVSPLKETVFHSTAATYPRTATSLKRETTLPQRETTFSRREATSLQEERILPQRETSPTKRETASPERETTPPQKRTFSQRDTISPQRETVSPQRDTATTQRDTTAPQKAATFPRRTLSEQRETISERETITPERYRFYHQREVTSVLTETNAPEREAVSLPAQVAEGLASRVRRRASQPITPTAVGLLAGESSVDRPITKDYSVK
ncbi:anoctamin-8-like [Littorina saxatilis]|uniref:Anoctamin n=1 Tax=Littorina saxatilis TaxID=31220 RepID=A0AAN9GPR2_9CAEN